MNAEIISLEMWAIIFFVGTGTFFIRFFFLGLLGSSKKEVPALIKHFLQYLPAAAFAALIAPRIFLPGLKVMQKGESNFLLAAWGFNSWGFMQFAKPWLQPVYFALFSQEALAAIAAIIAFYLVRSITLTIVVGMVVFWFLQNYFTVS